MTNHARQLESKIVYYNDMYRKGTPVITDQVFDTILDQFEALVTADEYTRVRESLFNTKGDTKHQYIIGSLKKTKAEDDSVLKWFNRKKTNVTSTLVVEKLDGMSMVLHYFEGKLVKAVSRGDGIYGKDYTTNVNKFAPTKLGIPFTGQIRCEVLLPISALAKLNNSGYCYKNPRNATTGIVTATTSPDKDALKLCRVIAYQIMGSNKKKEAQYKELFDLGFTLPKREKLHTVYDKVSPDSLKSLYEAWSKTSDYEIDGLVIHNLKYGDENLKLPLETIAFKVNDLVATTTVKGIEWNMSRSKQYKPVVLLEPIELGGSTIRRATGNNYRNIKNLNLSVGSTVTIEKAGDIIPKIINVIPNNSGLLVVPSHCIHCNTPLMDDSVNLVCNNPTCTGNAVKQLNSYLRKLGVEGFSESTLEKWNLKTIKDVLDFYPTTNNGKKFMNELYGNVFNKSKVELIIALPFQNFGSTLVKRIMDAYGKQRLAHNFVPVNGISDERQKDFKEQFAELVKWVECITHDNRWKPQVAKRVTTSPVTNKLKGLSFCFTGKLETMTRSEAEKYVKANGGECRSVSDKLTYLVTNNPNSGTSKNRKAQNLGVQLITEKQFGELIGKKVVSAKDTSVQTGQVFDINDL